MNKYLLCPKPWTDIIFDQRGQSFCCESSLGYKGEIGNFFENNSELRKLFRQAILKNKNQASCHNCIKFDCPGILSERDFALKNHDDEVYKTTGFDGETSRNLENIKINFSSHPGAFRLAQSFLSDKVQSRLDQLVASHPKLLLFSNIHYSSNNLSSESPPFASLIEKHIKQIRQITISLNQYDDISKTLQLFKELSKKVSLKEIELRLETYYAYFDSRLTEISQYFKNVKYVLQSFGNLAVHAYILDWDENLLGKNLESCKTNAKTSIAFETQLYITPYLYEINLESCDFIIDIKDTLLCHHPFDHSKTDLFPLEIQSFFKDSFQIPISKKNQIEANEFYEYNRVFDDTFELTPPSNVETLFRFCQEVAPNPALNQKIKSRFLVAIEDRNEITASHFSKIVSKSELTEVELKTVAEFFLSVNNLLLSLTYFEEFIKRAKTITHSIKDLAWKLKKIGDHREALLLHSLILKHTNDEKDIIESLISGGFEELDNELRQVYIDLLDEYCKDHFEAKIQKSLLLKKMTRLKESLDLHFDVLENDENSPLIRKSLLSGGWLGLKQPEINRLINFLENSIKPNEFKSAKFQLAIIYKHIGEIETSFQLHKEILSKNGSDEATEIVNSLISGGWDKLSTSSKLELIQMLEENRSVNPIIADSQRALLLKERGSISDSLTLHLNILKKDSGNSLIRRSLTSGGWLELNKSELLVLIDFLLKEIKPEEKREADLQLALIYKSIDEIEKAFALHKKILQEYGPEESMDILDSLFSGGWNQLSKSTKVELIQVLKDLRHFAPLRSDTLQALLLKETGFLADSLDLHLKLSQSNIEIIKKSIVSGGWDTLDNDLIRKLLKQLDQLTEEYPKEVLYQKAFLYKKLKLVNKSSKYHLDYLEKFGNDELILQSIRSGGLINSQNDQNERLIEFYSKDKENLESTKALAFGLKLIGQLEKSLKIHLKIYNTYSDQEIKTSILSGGWKIDSDELNKELKGFIENNLNEMSTFQKIVHLKENKKFDEAVTLIKDEHLNDESIRELLLLPGWRALSVENHEWYRNFLNDQPKSTEVESLISDYADVVRIEFNESEFLKTLLLLTDPLKKEKSLITLDWQKIDLSTHPLLIEELEKLNNKDNVKIILSKLYYSVSDYKKSYQNYLSSIKNNEQLLSFLKIDWVELKAVDSDSHIELLEKLDVSFDQDKIWLKTYATALAYRWSDADYSKKIISSIDINPNVIVETTGLSQAAHLFHKLDLNLKAIELFNILLENNLIVKDDLKLLGWLYKSEKEFSKARAVFQRVLSIDSTDPQALDELKRLNSGVLNKIKNTLRRFI